jgi:hypothetical protein
MRMRSKLARGIVGNETAAGAKHTWRTVDANGLGCMTRFEGNSPVNKTCITAQVLQHHREANTDLHPGGTLQHARDVMHRGGTHPLFPFETHPNLPVAANRVKPTSESVQNRFRTALTPPTIAQLPRTRPRPARPLAR